MVDLPVEDGYHVEFLDYAVEVPPGELQREELDPRDERVGHVGGHDD